MTIKKKYTFEPDYVVAPGVTLKEALETRGMSQSDLAIRADMAEKTISQIINAVAPITVDTADKFELVLGIPASFWNRRELSYRESLKRLEETQKLQASVAWLKEVPVKELINRGLIEPTVEKPLLVRRLLEFFGVSSVEAWRKVLHNSVVQFRGGSAHEKYPGYVAAWRRIGVLMAQEISTDQFDAQEFRKALAMVRRMTTQTTGVWTKEMPKVCAAAGVAVVLVPEIQGASISGAARWLTPDKALIQLSLKYRSDDQFWFTFFHEAGHILLHGRKQTFVDYGYSSDTEEERDANNFARDILIPPEYDRQLPTLITRRQIRQFADSIGVTPGIVVGRLQHDKMRYVSAFNDLKRKFEWE